MPIRRSTSRNLPFLADLTERDRQRTERALAARDRTRDAEQERVAKQLERSVESADRKRRDLLGAKAERELQKFLQTEQRALTARLQPPGGLKLDRAKASAARARRVDAFVKTLGVSPAALQKVGLVAREDLRRLLDAQLEKKVAGHHLRNNLTKWKKLSPLNALSLPFDVELETDWQVFRPPFFGFLWRHDHSTARDFVISSDHLLDPQAGLVGNWISMSVPDLGQYDLGCAWIETMIGFGFVPTSTGLLEILIEAQNARGVHDLETENCFGFSDSLSIQQNTLFAELLHPNAPEASGAEMSYFEKDTDADGRWNFSNLTRGQSYYAQLISSGPLAAGEHVVILIGTRTYFYSVVDDVKTSGTPSFRWFIGSVQVRTLPGTPPPPIT
jgi:hypothetical protein